MKEMAKRYKKTMLRVGAALLLWMIMFYGLAFVSAMVSEIIGEFCSPTVTEVVSSLISAAAYLAAFILASFLFHVIDKQSYDCPLRFTPILPKNSFAIIFAGVACTFALSFLNTIVVSMMGFSSPVEIFSYPAEYSSDVSLILQLISIGLVPAFCEELLFRGVILSNLMPYGKASAVIISSVLFGLMHGNIYQFIYTTVAGLIMGSVYVLTDSLWCSIILHMINNSLSVLQSALMDRFSDEHGMVLTILFFITVIFIGTLCIFRLVTKRGSDGEDLSDHISKLTFSGEVSIRETARGFLVPTVLVFVILSWLEGFLTASLI